MARYLDELSPLRELLVESSGTVAGVNAEAIAIVRNLIRQVVVHATDDGGFEVEIIGDLAALTGEIRMFPNCSRSARKAVARAGPSLFNYINDLEESGTHTRPIVSQDLSSRRSHRTCELTSARCRAGLRSARRDRLLIRPCQLSSPSRPTLPRRRIGANCGKNQRPSVVRENSLCRPC